jgi:hypothetical protein
MPFKNCLSIAMYNRYSTGYLDIRVLVFPNLNYVRVLGKFFLRIRNPNILCSSQCCGFGRFLIGSGSDFRKRPHPDPDPDPDLNKFSDNFILDIFLAEICSKKCIHEPKSLATEIHKVFMALTHTKIVYAGAFFKARIRIRS